MRSLSIAAVLALSAPALASTADVFGMGSRATAMAQANTAAAEDFTAVWYNPAGLVHARGFRFSLGAMVHSFDLEVQDRTQGVPDPVGFWVGVDTPVPFGGWLADRVYAGLAFHLVPGKLIYVIGHSPEDAYFPLYENRTQRLVVMPGLAFKVLDWLAIGAGLNYLSGFDGIITGRMGPYRATESSANQDLIGRLSSQVGVRVEPNQTLGFALTFREEFFVPFRTASEVMVAGSPLGLIVESQVLYTPHELALGGKLALGDHLLTLDATLKLWSRFPGQYVEVDASLPAVLGPEGSKVLLHEPLPDVDFRDTVSVAAGWEGRFDLDGLALRVRAGAGFEPSPVPEQSGHTNLADGDKLIGGLGFGLAELELLGLVVSVDTHAALHLLLARSTTKALAALPDEDGGLAGLQTSNPGYPSLESSGTVASFGITFSASKLP